MRQLKSKVRAALRQQPHAVCVSPMGLAFREAAAVEFITGKVVEGYIPDIAWVVAARAQAGVGKVKSIGWRVNRGQNRGKGAMPAVSGKRRRQRRR